MVNVLHIIVIIVLQYTCIYYFCLFLGFQSTVFIQFRLTTQSNILNEDLKYVCIPSPNIFNSISTTKRPRNTNSAKSVKYILTPSQYKIIKI